MPAITIGAISIYWEISGVYKAQFAFVNLRLESSPADLRLELLKHANLTGTFDYQLILDQLERHNGIADTDKVQRAKTKLHTLKQTGSFNSFLKWFEITLVEAGSWGWDDDRKIDTLRPCLNDYLKRKLEEHDVAGTKADRRSHAVSWLYRRSIRLLLSTDKRRSARSGMDGASQYQTNNVLSIIPIRI